MTKDAENWQLLQDLFHLAETTPEADRERVLTAKCPDEKLRRRAMNIFEAAKIEDEVETSVATSAQDAAQMATLSGKIGPYTLIKLLGTGGIGAVYLVERMVGGALQQIGRAHV